MYQGKYPETGLPPGYNGTAYKPPQEPEPPCEPEVPADIRNDIPPDLCPPRPSPPENTGGNIFQGITEHLFSHSIDMEDLLLIGLTVMLINSGADSSLIIAMAMLFVMGL